MNITKPLTGQENPKRSPDKTLYKRYLLFKILLKFIMAS